MNEHAEHPDTIQTFCVTLHGYVDFPIPTGLPAYTVDAAFAVEDAPAQAAIVRRYLHLLLSLSDEELLEDVDLVEVGEVLNLHEIRVLTS